LVALFMHYIGWKHRTYGAWPMTTYEPLPWTHAFECAFLAALIASVWITIKNR
jgi:hypothetical protein